MSPRHHDLFARPKRLFIPGYTRQDAHVTRQIVFPPVGIPDKGWYSAFTAEVFDALEKRKYFPVFRSGHGEFLFTLGRLDRPKTAAKLMRYCASRVVNTIKFRSAFYSGTPGYGYETYRWWKIPRLRKRYASALKVIHSHGAHCLYFSDRDACSFERQKAYARWLTRRTGFDEVKLYWHVYFVYALLLGDEGRRIFEGRRVLIVTSNIERRRAQCGESLYQLGARSVEFAEISRSHALEDDLPRVSGEHDLALVGGGVGASNILAQLSRYSRLCIDAGFALDCFEVPKRRQDRIYCAGDADWEQIHGNEPPIWADKFSDQYSQMPETTVKKAVRLC